MKLARFICAFLIAATILPTASPRHTPPQERDRGSQIYEGDPKDTCLSMTCAVCFAGLLVLVGKLATMYGSTCNYGGQY